MLNTVYKFLISVLYKLLKLKMLFDNQPQIMNYFITIFLVTIEIVIENEIRDKRLANFYLMKLQNYY